MITHFSNVTLDTVSLQGVRQFYSRLGFPVERESAGSITLRVSTHFTLTFRENDEPLRPAHLALQVPVSAFAACMKYLREQGIPLLTWEDGREVTLFEGGGCSVYFRDGDGNLLELIAYTYVAENVLPESGPLRVLYLREAGFPTRDVPQLREWMKRVLGMRTGTESDIFTFVVGGTAHAVVTSVQRRWIPIAMVALPPRMEVVLATPDPAFLEQVRGALGEDERIGSRDGRLRFQRDGYLFELILDETFPADLPVRLGLPLSQPGFPAGGVKA